MRSLHGEAELQEVVQAGDVWAESSDWEREVDGPSGVDDAYESGLERLADACREIQAAGLRPAEGTVVSLQRWEVSYCVPREKVMRLHASPPLVHLVLWQAHRCVSGQHVKEEKRGCARQVRR